MRVDIKKLTNVVNKISDLTVGDKVIPGVLLRVKDNSLDVCYTDGHKALIEVIEVETSEDDKYGNFAVDYALFKRAVDNCQSSGSIFTDVAELKWSDKVIEISAEQKYIERNEEGEVIKESVLSTKKMNVAWYDPESTMKLKVLTRADYDSFFNCESPDVYEKDELVDVLSRTSTEKGRSIYVSAKTQTVFVSNQAHCTAVPVSGIESVAEDGSAVVEGRITRSIVLPQGISKALTSILSKVKSSDVYVSTKERYCTMYIEDGEEKLAIWFEMAVASNVHTSTVEKFNQKAYSKYQIIFMRDFLVDLVKSAIASAKDNDKNRLKFNIIDSEDPTQPADKLQMELKAGSASASIDDNYKIVAKDFVDSVGDITSREFIVSLKLTYEMLNQLKTHFVVMDFDIDETGQQAMRLAEIDIDKYKEKYAEARENFIATSENPEEACNQPTPAEFKVNLRDGSLKTKQYCLLQKA